MSGAKVAILRLTNYLHSIFLSEGFETEDVLWHKNMTDSRSCLRAKQPDKDT